MPKEKLIEPRTLKGFRDYAPALMIPRERVLETARRVYRSYGYAPIDTPAMEYAEVLLGKGGGENDKIVYRFKDHGDRDVALRFDLTVPFARFAAQEVPKLGTPFKRYAMGPVWRGENTGHGRYREFWQCDFDTIGTTANASDIEVALVINDLFENLGFEQFEIRINNRLVLNGILELAAMSHQSVTILRALDKLPKIGRAKVFEELRQIQGVTEGSAEMILMIATFQKSNIELLDDLEAIMNDVNVNALSQEVVDKGKALVASGIQSLKELLTVAKAAGVPDGRIRIDLSIARGLDYYTGTIFETFLLGDYDDKGKPAKLSGFGSVCSGGRYDNLASLYTKQVLPGVGASLGVDRLLAAMEAMKHPWLGGRSTPADVLVIQMDAGRLGESMRIAQVLRKAGLAAEVYPDPGKKLKSQFEYADKRGFRFTLLAGSEEIAAGVWKIKDLAKREERTVTEAELVAAFGT